MAFPCAICAAEVVDQAEYTRHLADVHELVDDPGASSAVYEPEPAQEPEPARTSVLPPLTFTPKRDPTNVLLPGERPLATLAGGKPAGADAAAIAAGLAGGAIGGAVLGAVRGKRKVDPPAGRALTITSQRVLLFESGVLALELPITDLKKVKVRRSQAGSARKVVEIKGAGATISIEGLASDVTNFVASIPKPR